MDTGRAKASTGPNRRRGGRQLGLARKRVACARVAAEQQKNNACIFVACVAAGLACLQPNMSGMKVLLDSTQDPIGIIFANRANL